MLLLLGYPCCGSSTFSCITPLLEHCTSARALRHSIELSVAENVHAAVPHTVRILDVLLRQAVPQWYTAGTLPKSDEAAAGDDGSAASSSSSSDDDDSTAPQQAAFDVLEGGPWCLRPAARFPLLVRGCEIT